MKKSHILCILILTIIIVTTALPVYSTTTNKKQEQDWFLFIGIIGPKKGFCGPEGSSAIEAMYIITNEINKTRQGAYGRDLKLLKADIKGDPQKAIEYIKGWLKKPLIGVISLAEDDINKAIAPLLERHKIPTILAFNEDLTVLNKENSYKPKDFIFSFLLSIEYYPKSIAKYLLMSGVQKVAVIFDILKEYHKINAIKFIKACEKAQIDVYPISVRGSINWDFYVQAKDLQRSGIKNVVIFTRYKDIWNFVTICKDIVFHPQIYVGVPIPIRINTDIGKFLNKSIWVNQSIPIGKGNRIDEFKTFFSLKRRHLPEDTKWAVIGYDLMKWFTTALLSAGSWEGKTVAEALSRIALLQLPDMVLSVNPQSHRPLTRKIAILRYEYKENNFTWIDTISVNSKPIIIESDIFP